MGVAWVPWRRWDLSAPWSQGEACRACSQRRLSGLSPLTTWEGSRGAQQGTVWTLPTPPTCQRLVSVLSNPNSPVAIRFHAGVFMRSHQRWLQCQEGNAEAMGDAEAVQGGALSIASISSFMRNMLIQIPEMS